jgi:hypothetical protein
MNRWTHCFLTAWPLRAVRLLASLGVLAACGEAVAHQVPSLTVEALFSADRSYTLRINVDPRLFISDQPSSLPPVPIEWYRDQKPEELAATRLKAAGYLSKALTIKFGETTAQLENCDFQPMDGATNMPLSADTKEVHLLAEAKGTVPKEQSSFALALSHDANVSMILMNSFEGTMERRPNVVFPGETSRAFELSFPAKTLSPATAPVIEKSAATAKNETRPTEKLLWPVAVGGILLIIFWALRWHRKQR